MISPVAGGQLFAVPGVRAPGRAPDQRGPFVLETFLGCGGGGSHRFMKSPKSGTVKSISPRRGVVAQGDHVRLDTVRVPALVSTR